MSDYLNLIHTLSIGCSPAQISFAAPLTFNGFVQAGTLVYNDLFTIYPYENQLFVIKMTGRQIREYLEVSYDSWINTVDSADDHVLKIVNEPDPSTGQEKWSFINRSYNFDSAAGLVYTVAITRPYGSRVVVASLADGSPFDEGAEYNVALTSYRASGGGGMMQAVGVDTDNIDDIVVEYYPEIRNILYDYLCKNGSIDPAVTGDKSVIGEWKFIPEPMAEEAFDRDMKLLFTR
jgi:2',3'-cyclic-nucleotide 2'-phosphodiesterase/3'-nucleotidase